MVVSSPQTDSPRFLDSDSVVPGLRRGLELVRMERELLLVELRRQAERRSAMIRHQMVKVLTAAGAGAAGCWINDELERRCHSELT